MFDLLNVPKNIRANLKVGKDYSNRESDSTEGGYPINQVEANFEYYIVPKATKGQYQFSSIFDQQLKTFSESPNVIYRNVLNGNSKIEALPLNTKGWIQWSDGQQEKAPHKRGSVLHRKDAR